ncbi:hypothetical protein KY329_03695 [Candidatus Woesearchaeota archaeon]|nr:hypothetical protein [Candidatus Woesearchaeota archaeon]
MTDYFNFQDDWPEFVALLFMVLGFVVAIMTDSTIAAYAVVFIMGLFFGRIWYRFEQSAKLPLILAILGCLLGIVLGLILHNLQLVLLLFVLGIIAGFWIHKRGWIQSEEF